MESTSPPASSNPTCVRCNENEAIFDLRTDKICPPCLAQFVANKTIKRLEVLQRTTRTGGPKQPNKPQKYLVALSRGTSSTSLLQILHENLQQQVVRTQRTKFQLLAVHVDTDLHHRPSSSSDAPSTQGLTSAEETYRSRFPNAEFLTVMLEDVLALDAIDWASLPPLHAGLQTPAEQLADLFARLPSTTSRADIQRLFTRHLLLSVAVREACDVLLLGSNTTALAELTLSETAKGRGFSLPWQINDGLFKVPGRLSTGGDDAGGAAEERTREGPKTIPIYHPLRELFRKELLTYTTITTPPLADIIVPESTSSPSAANGKAAAIVSHKDLSIEEVMTRYFAEVEENYPSVVANVVRTTGKLARPEGENGHCGLCDIGLDEAGDERWRGELGEQKGVERPDGRKLCYGCDRSIYG
ncbi:uncharacterized protein BCR38DRAFT_463187 [Pseudomassariella vexata]|uniref:Cytoplasmic tRNA 2-thiolation protein 2 n=1 Tax=Pseudomassariella vexata TaxID=1141098 RepID=A0A1Y2EDL3_9PEZI|nr:uncharacterized protein BCR38DRAFT_463187 [Pseudomassariella vexata]ORY69661.1 hypothetical protein BCR38DRAFT_463187 [Pseudomassariella vexata]